LYFDPISFGDPPKKYIDGALYYNNPVRVLWDEANTVWKNRSSRTIGCIISIGTGTPLLHAIGKRAHNIVRTLIKMATDTETAAQEFADANRHIDQVQRPAYFRFNVEQGLEKIGLEEWKRFETLVEATDAYLSGKRQEIDDCVNSLVSLSRKWPGLPYTIIYLTWRSPKEY
jgi:hypothetical protein